jgi:septum formation protein
LIQTFQLPVLLAPSDVDESVEPRTLPEEMVRQLSLRKASASRQMLDPSADGIVVGSDTIVVLNGEVLGKPTDEQDAARMLRAFQGQVHEVYTGVACIDTMNDTRIVAHSMTKVTMKALTDKQIERYIRTGEPMDKAGAYGIQGIGATLIERIEGDYFTVVGLPLALLSDMLADMGIDVV